METVNIKATVVNPGKIMIIKFSALARIERNQVIEPDEWGICGHENCFWVGERGEVDGEEVLRLTYQEIENRRNEKYSEWGDEELYLHIGPGIKEKKFAWYLLNEEEMREDEKRENTPVSRTLN